MTAVVDRISGVQGIQHKRVKELIAREEMNEAARFFEDQYCGGDCVGRFSTVAPGVHLRRSQPKRLNPGFHSACGKSGTRF
jgi:hypothetical protein